VSEESYSYLSDEDLELIDTIAEGAIDRKHGEAILHIYQEGERLKQAQTRSLLDAIGQAHQAKSSASESGAESLKLEADDKE
jgi:hypothetical protein